MLSGNYIDTQKKNYKKVPVKDRGHVKVEVYANIDWQEVQGLKDLLPGITLTWRKICYMANQSLEEF